MLALHNQIQLIGRAGHEVELLPLTDGTHRATLRLYQNNRLASHSEEPQVHSLVAWNNVATQMAMHIHRGDRIMVQGRLLNRKLQVSGQTIVKGEIHVASFTVLSSRSVTRSVGIAAEPGPEKVACNE